MTALRDTIARLARGDTLTRAEAAAAIDAIVGGAADPAQIGAFLMALRLRGETVDELTGAAEALRGAMLPFEGVPGALDIVGTGGDGHGSINISSAAALVVAAAGVPVAKHGNRSVSSRSGSADVMAALGIDLEASPARSAAQLSEHGFCFLFAPRYHPAMAAVAPARRALGIRTLFNLVGPLCNPARVGRLLLGVYDARWLEPMAATLGALGCARAWVVHGHGALDEIATTGATQVAEWHAGRVNRFSVTPGDAGLPVGAARDIAGGTPEENAAMICRLLAGEVVACRDSVVLNAAAALVVAGAADDLREGAARARAALDSGAAATLLRRQRDMPREVA